MKYVELIQVQIIFNMRFLFWKMWLCFEDAEKCVVAKVFQKPQLLNQLGHVNGFGTMFCIG